jgi:large subunit ribosomal protein L13
MRIKTFVTTPTDIERERRWWIIDAEGQTLGRLASKIAPVLQGKNKAIYTPNLDTGDYVIVINAAKIAVTGKRMDDKMYYRHSQYPSGLTEMNLRDLLAKFPDRPLQIAIRGMLPKTRLGRQMIKKLKIYAGADHPHAAQNPQPLTLEL